MPERKWVTMGDVAKHAGVGTMTVSRALRTPSKVSPETLARVQAAVSELGYVRDETAGALSSQRTRVVGALVSTLEQTVFATTIRGLEEGLREGGLHLLLASTGYDPQTEAALLPTLLGRRPDAIVLTSSEHLPQTRRLLAEAALPVFELWELPRQPIHAAVGFSNRAAARDMTRHLRESGRRRIAFLRTQRAADTRADLRQQGYMEWATEARVVSIPANRSDSGADYGARGLAEILTRWPDTDAVFCVSDALALGAWCEAMRRGIAVPDRLAIVGFGDVDFAGAAGIGLTTVRIDGESIGRRAAQMILGSAAGTPPAEPVVDMGYALVLRATG